VYFHVSRWWQSRERVKAARQGKEPGSSATATSCPPRGRQAGRQPSTPRREPEPNEPHTSRTHAHPGPVPAGRSDAAPTGPTSSGSSVSPPSAPSVLHATGLGMLERRRKGEEETSLQGRTQSDCPCPLPRRAATESAACRAQLSHLTTARRQIYHFA